MNDNNDETIGFTLAIFNEDGKSSEATWIDRSDERFCAELVQSLNSHLGRLSGDLDLPLEGHLPMKSGKTVFRVSSDGANSFTFYYLKNDIIGLSLTLTGNDREAEAEIIDSIRLLLLETEDLEDQESDQIEKTLSVDEFDFQSFDQRPIHFFVPLVGSDLEVPNDLVAGSMHVALVLCQKAI
jgi:hypothetical protein